MAAAIRECVDDHNTGHDQGKTEDRREIQGLLVDNPSQQCDESDSGACPDGVNGAGRNGLERERQEVERDCVAGDDDDARPQPGKSIG